MEQGSTEWLRARAGKVTASRVADVIAKTKTGYGASRANYMAELIAERLTGEPAEKFVNAAMSWGTEKEPEARALYSFMEDCVVEQVGFIEHPTIPMCGASPDGLIGDDGMVEIKCPNMSAQGDMPVSRAEMAVKGSDEWADYIKTMVAAREQAEMKRVHLEYIRMKFMEWQSANATQRAEMRLAS